MGLRDLVNKFTSGELDPKFIAEVDYEGYRKAARKLRNVVATPQGGAARRFGTFYEQTIMDGVAFVTNPDQVRLIEYEHLNNELYDIVIRPSSTDVVAFDIYLFGVLQAIVPAPANTYTVDIIREIRWVKDYERIILLHQSIRPYELRIVAPTNWVMQSIPFQFFPTFDFSSSDNPSTLPTPNVPYTSPGVTFTPNAMVATTVTASTAVYTSNHVGGLYFGNGGVFRITAVNSGGTVATGYVLEDFEDTSAIKGELSVLLERAWNDGAAIGGAPAGIVRGWPGRGCFYQSRLVMGGSPALQGTAFASNVKSYFDFDDSNADSTASWDVEIGVTGNDILFDILATKSLVLLSNKGPASTSILIDTPTTPANAFMNTQGTEGSRNMNSVIIDNQIIYADRAGNTIWSMAYEIPDTGYNIQNASILSTQLIRNPRWADIFDPDDIDGRYYLLVNSDGSLAVYNTISAENIKAWTLSNTVGSFVDVACVANQAKVLTRRKVVVTTPVGLIDAIYTVDSTFNAFRNITVSVNTAMPTSVFANDGDYVLLGSEIVFTQIGLTFGLVSGENINPIFQFLTDTGEWETFSPTDGTNGFTQDGTISWTEESVSNWKAQPIRNTTQIYNEYPNYYWIRIKRNNSNTFVNPYIDGLLINTENRIYMEKLDFSIYMDSQIATTSDADGIVSAPHLAGQNAFVFINDFPKDTFYVDETGMVDLTSTYGNSDITIGLDYKTNITPMPIVAILGNGLSVYEPVHVSFMYIDYYQSLGMVINGQNFPQISPGDFLTEEVPIPVSDYYKVPTYNGWDPRVEFVITQSYPAPMTILAVSYTIQVSP